MMTPNEQFDEKEKALRNAKKSATIVCPPEVFFGWNGNPDHPGLDMAQYERHGYPHPREQSYYSPDNPEIIALRDGIEQTGYTDPFEVYLDESMHELLVLDGARRSCCVSLIQRTNSEAFRRVRANVFKGTKQEAIARMVSLNLDDRRRALTPIQVARTCKKWVDWGWTPAEICERLGKPASWRGELVNLLKLLNGSDELHMALDSGAIGKGAALQIAQLAPAQQAEAIRKLGKMTKGEAKAEVRKAREGAGIRPMGPNYQPHLRFDKFAGYLGNDFTVWMNGKDELPDGVEELRNDLIEMAERMSQLLTGGQ